MEEDFKPRDEHRGPQNPYVGLSHQQKDKIENAARAADQGPTFGTPGDPPALDPDVKAKLDDAYEDLDREEGVPRSG